MNMLKKRLALALSLALCVMPLSASLALAETNTSPESVGTTSNAQTTDVSQPATDSDVAADTNVSTDADVTMNPDVATDTDATTDPATTDTDVTEETDTGEVPDGSEIEEELPPVLDENGEVVEPGTLPDSPFYWLTTLIEKLQVILTFDPVEKTELLEDQALERIAEAGVLIEKGDSEQAEGALKAYSEKVAEAQAFVALLAETDSETTQKLETALSQTHAKNVQTLGGLLDKLPPQAAQRVAVNIVRSMEKSIAKMDKKDLKMVAKELKKATKGIEDDSELTEEDETALENLDQVLEPQEGATLNTLALTTNSLTTQNMKSQVIKQTSEAKAKLKPTVQQEQKLAPNVEDKNVEPKDEAKGEDKSNEAITLGQKQQQEIEGKLKAEQESALKEKDPSSSNSANNSTKKQDSEKTQQKASNHEKGDKSGGKGR